MNLFIVYRTFSPNTPTPPDYSRDYSSAVDWIKYSMIKFENNLEELKKFGTMEDLSKVLEGFQKVHDEVLTRTSDWLKMVGDRLKRSDWLKAFVDETKVGEWIEYVDTKVGELRKSIEDD